MPGPSIADTFGAALIGLLVGTLLFGLTIAQTWIYFWNYQNTDPKALKYFIAFVTVMDALHTTICAYSMYWYLILNFGNFESLEYAIWALNAQGVISTFISAPVQFYYARRVYIVSKDINCPIVIVVLATVASSLAFFFVAKETAFKQFLRLHSMAGIACVGLTAGASADLLIAVAMCRSLYRRRTGFARTDSIIISLMAYSINSGLLVCLLAVAVTISFVVSPYSLIWEAIYWTMSKCYVNSLLAMLNSRDYIRGRSTIDNSEDPINSCSIRIEQSADAYGEQSEPTFGVPKPGAYRRSESNA